MKISDKNLIKIIKAGSVGVLPSETLYGLMCLADSKKTVERLYKIRKRNPKRPCIILISKIKDLEIFGVKPSKEEKEFLKKYWPGAVSVILECKSKKFEFLHRGTETLAFRMPKKKNLKDLISKTGPILAPSANPEGKSTALTIKEAKKYFTDEVDFYVPAGKLEKKASTLVKLRNGKVEILRQGETKINNLTENK